MIQTTATLASPPQPVSTAPFWFDDIVAPADPTTALPRSVDVAIIGAGYTGLSAAHETAGAGRSTLVLDAGRFGHGCSGRNGGQAAYSIKPTLAELTDRHGAQRAMDICREGFAAVENLRTLAHAEKLDFDYRTVGAFYGAHTRKKFDALLQEAEHQTTGVDQRISVVSRADQAQEIATDFYHGGLVYHDDAAVHPAKLLIAMLARARRAGAQVLHECGVRALQRTASGFELQTDRGVVQVKQVLIATNGYTGPLSPWERRRVIPIGSYQIATAPLGLARVRDLIRHGRNVGDTRRVVVYYRPSPDGQRIIFGGRAALAEKNALAVVPRMRAMLTQILPQLHDAAITHAWVGTVAFTFDKLLHLGERDNLFHCMGYCGSGVPMATYFGKRIGQQMLGLPEGRTAFDNLEFQTRPLYSGVPWFLAPSMFYYRALDALGI